MSVMPDDFIRNINRGLALCRPFYMKGKNMETAVEVLSEISFTSDIWIILIVAACIIADFITGFMQAWINNCIQSHIMREGIAHKTIECVILALAWVAWKAIVFPPSLRWIDIRVIVAIYLCLNELTSILENVNRAGIWVPKWVVKKLQGVKDKADEGELPHKE